MVDVVVTENDFVRLASSGRAAGDDALTEITSTELQRGFGDVLHRVAVGRERLVMTAHGRPQVVLVSARDYARLAQDARIGRVLAAEDARRGVGEGDKP